MTAASAAKTQTFFGICITRSVPSLRPVDCAETIVRYFDPFGLTGGAKRNSEVFARDRPTFVCIFYIGSGERKSDRARVCRARGDRQFGCRLGSVRARGD